MLSPSLRSIPWLFWSDSTYRSRRRCGDSAIACLPVVVGIKMAAFMAFHSHRGWWRYATFADLIKLAQAATLGSGTLLVLSRFSFAGSAIPRSVILIDWAATFIVIGGIRAGARLVREDICRLIATRAAPTVVGRGHGRRLGRAHSRAP